MLLGKLALARGLGIRELVATIDMDEVKFWWAFDNVVGLPDPWACTAIQSAWTVNVWADKDKRVKPEDMVPLRKRPKQDKSRSILEGMMRRQQGEQSQ